MSHFMQVVSPGASYPAVNAPDVSIPFVPDTYDLVNETATAALVSFDGTNDHDRVPGNGSVTLRTKAAKIWLKGAGASVRVKARTDV